MFTRSLPLTAGVAMFFAASVAEGQVGTVRLDRNQVVPVFLQEDLSSEESRRGDRFYAVVSDGYDLPRGTRFVGRVIDIQRRRGDRPAYVEAEFTEIVLPDGTRTRVRAIPISLNDDNVRRDRDGRLRTTGSVVRKERVVGTGALAGLVIGALTKKPFEGLVWGTIAGIIVAEGQSAEARNESIRLRSGTRIGALIEEPVRVSVGNYRYDERRDETYRDDRWNRDQDYGDDRWERDDRWNRDDTWNRDDRWDQDQRWDQDDRYYEPIRISYRGNELRFARDHEPYRIGGTIMVPLERTARQLDLEVDMLQGSDVILVEDEDSLLKIEQGTRTYRLNGKRGTLSREIARRDGEVYIPLEILAGMKSSPINANGRVYRQ